MLGKVLLKCTASLTSLHLYCFLNISQCAHLFNLAHAHPTFIRMWPRRVFRMRPGIQCVVGLPHLISTPKAELDLSVAATLRAAVVEALFCVCWGRGQREVGGVLPQCQPMPMASSCEVSRCHEISFAPKVIIPPFPRNHK